MEQQESNDPVVSASGTDTPALVASAARPAVSSLAPQPCLACGAAPATNGGVAATPSYVYAIGRIEPRFPRLSVEKELAQVTGRADTAGLNDRQALERVLSERQNRYLVRQLCWVMTIEGLETYILQPRDPVDFDLHRFQREVLCSGGCDRGVSVPGHQVATVL
jgi:PatG Domain